MGKRAVLPNKAEERVLGGLENWWKGRQSLRQTLEGAGQAPEEAQEEAQAPKAAEAGGSRDNGMGGDGQGPARPRRPGDDGKGR
jgi:hypothetical protein